MREQFTSMPIMLETGGKKWTRTVPFAMLNEEWAQRNHSQSLQRLAERGGLGPDEAIAIMDKRRWMAMPTEAALTILARRLDAAEPDNGYGVYRVAKRRRTPRRGYTTGRDE